MNLRGFVATLAPWRRGYQTAWLRSDIVAGVSVAAVALPIAIAYSQLAGVPPVYGLYASLLPLLAYAVFGSSRQLIMAPDAATCAIIAAVVAPLALHDASRYLALTSALAIIAGVFCIVAGFARLGFLTNFLARPILTGYLNGIAICIISGQLGPLFGFQVASSGFFRTIWHFAQGLPGTHPATLAVGATTLALLFALSRTLPKVPGPLVAVALGIAASAWFGLSGMGVALLGAIPAGLPALVVPRIAATDWEPLAMGAIGLALISYNSAMVTARSFAARNHYDIDANREFIALGVSNIGAGFSQGFAVSGADSRTAVNDAVGGKTPLTSLVAAIALGLTLLFLTRPLSLLPIAVLSAILIKAAMGLFDIRALRELRRVSPPEFRLALVAMLGVITVGVLPGVVVAVVAALAQLLVRASLPHDAVLGRVAGSDAFVDIATHSDAVPTPGVLVYRFDAALLFFNADHFRARARALAAGAGSGVRHFVLDAETMPWLDTTGVASLEHVHGELADLGMVLSIASAKAPVRGMLDRSGVGGRIGARQMFASLAAAVDAAATDSLAQDVTAGEQRAPRDAI